MALFLLIESSGPVCSVGISENDKLLGLIEDQEGRSHGKMLPVYIKDLLSTHKLKISDLDAVAFSSGPGSFTGLRIGLSLCKGICLAASIPLIFINTLDSLADCMKKTCNPKEGLISPMIDARRMEVYTAIYDFEMQLISDYTPLVVGDDTYFDLLEKNNVFIAGDGAKKASSLINHKNLIYLNEVYCSASNMPELVFKKWQTRNFTELVYAEPFYLKSDHFKKQIPS